MSTKRILLNSKILHLDIEAIDLLQISIIKPPSSCENSKEAQLFNS